MRSIQWLRPTMPEMQIARTDPAALLAWVLLATKKLDALKPRSFRYESPTTGKVQEVICAWDETPVQELKTFVVRDKETKALVLDENGQKQFGRYVRISSRPLTYFEQAQKLVGMFPTVLKAWGGCGIVAISRMLIQLRSDRQPKKAEAVFFDYQLPIRKQIQADIRKAARREEREELHAMAKNHDIREYIKYAL